MKTEIAKLLEERHLPEILKMKDGSEVTRENFPERRREMLDILAEYEYGTMPSPIGETTWKEEAKFEVSLRKGKREQNKHNLPDARRRELYFSHKPYRAENCDC